MKKTYDLYTELLQQRLIEVTCAELKSSKQLICPVLLIGALVCRLSSN